MIKTRQKAGSATARPGSKQEARPALAGPGSNHKATPLTAAAGIASLASSLVGGERDRQHGAKRDNFERIAKAWNAWLAIRRDPAAPLDAHDVGIMMVFMKAARTQSGSLNPDDYVDMCGYAACAGEVAQD